MQGKTFFLIGAQTGGKDTGNSGYLGSNFSKPNDLIFTFFYRFLLAQLSVNLKPLWENSFKVIETYGADGDMEGFWSVWLEIFKEMNVKAASTPDQGNLFRVISNKIFNR